MVPYFRKDFGNPSSSHAYGRDARLAIEDAREQVAHLIGAESGEIVFTSGGTESDNHAITGVALANRRRGRHIITSRIEHPAVLGTCRYLEESLGFKTTYLPVDGYGLVDPSKVEEAITDDTILITVMHANNEVGTIEPIKAIGEIARSNGIIFHTDAAQSCGKIDVDVDKLNVDLLTVAGHKIYAPKGVGALYVREGVAIDSIIHGAGQELGRRAGTENVPYAVGLGKASEIAAKAIAEMDKIGGLRDLLYSNLCQGLGERVRLNGHPERRVPNTLNISIKGVVGAVLLSKIPEIAASTGSACHSGSFEPSKVLLEMGLTREEALGAVRLSLGRSTTRDDVDVASNLVIERVKSHSDPTTRVGAVERDQIYRRPVHADAPQRRHGGRHE